MTDTLPPTAVSIRPYSRLLTVDFPSPDADAELQTIVDQSIALVESLTWRLLDPLSDTDGAAPEGYVSEAVPPELVPVAFVAVARMAERIDVTTEPDFARQLATGRLLRGFTAGPYSESYFAPGEFNRRGASQGRPPMDPDAALDEALWALATEDARDYFVFRATGQAQPAGAAAVFDYRRQSRGYNAGGLGGRRAGFGPGPDGF